MSDTCIHKIINSHTHTHTQHTYSIDCVCVICELLFISLSLCACRLSCVCVCMELPCCGYAYGLLYAAPACSARANTLSSYIYML